MHNKKTVNCGSFKKRKSFRLFGVLILGLIAAFPVALKAQDEAVFPKQEDTMLMFVGETLEVLTVASRREESAWQAPAIARVITRKDIVERGVQTLGEALEMSSGFHMAKKEWGTQPYLRGIPDSVLFLYDTVPMGSDISKTIHPLDEELSLSAVKRIEIVKGPGSVLWGPDAFAGVVNVVPMTGKDLQGVETGILYGAPGNRRAVFSNMGYDTGTWDAFLSLSAHKGEEDDTHCNLVDFWTDGDFPVSPDERFGDLSPGDSRYLEMFGRFNYQDWVSVSGRFSDNLKTYAVSDSEGEITWRESQTIPFSFLKIEAKKELDRFSVLRFTGSYSQLNSTKEVVNYEWDQKERTTYAEMIYDRSFMAGSSLFTAGVSFREKRIENAPVWNGYLPQYLGSENELFQPKISEEAYNARLGSLFAQYTHKFGNIDVWAGARYDAHDVYKDQLSYNAGLAWFYSQDWVYKILYGTAYRTPFSRQLLEDHQPDLEEIQSLNLQIAWQPEKPNGVTVCGFYSRIANHIMEDPYAGLSLPNHQNIWGAEIDMRYSPHQTLELGANFTFLGNSGPDETYKYGKYFYIDPDNGEIIWEYVDLNYSYDLGPDKFLNLHAAWRPLPKLTTFLRFGYFASREFAYYPQNQTFFSSPGVWLIDASVTLNDMFIPDSGLTISFKNLTDEDYDTPGTYNTIEGEPLTLRIEFRKRW